MSEAQKSAAQKSATQTDPVSESAGPPPAPEDAAPGDTAPVDVSEPPHPDAPLEAEAVEAPPRRDDFSVDNTHRTATTTQTAAEPTTTITASEPPKRWSLDDEIVMPERTLRLVRLDAWSVTRMAFVTSVAMMVVAVVAAGVLWILLAIGGVFGSINDSVGSVAGGGFDVKNYLGFGRMIGGALVLSAINVVGMTALATVGAHLYNLVAARLGGVAVVFGEGDDEGATATLR